MCNFYIGVTVNRNVIASQSYFERYLYSDCWCNISFSMYRWVFPFIAHRFSLFLCTDSRGYMKIVNCITILQSDLFVLTCSHSTQPIFGNKYNLHTLSQLRWLELETDHCVFSYIQIITSYWCHMHLRVCCVCSRYDIRWWYDKTTSHWSHFTNYDKCMPSTKVKKHFTKNEQ